MQFLENIDTEILVFIHNNFTGPFMDKLMTKVTFMGNAGCIWIVIGLILALSSRYRKYGFMVIGSLIFCFVIGNLGLKPLVARARPYNFNEFITLLIDAPLDYSFPSGHTMTSFASACILYYMNKKVGVIAYALATTIAFSRLYLYVHYPSDVLVGLIISLFISKIVIKITEILENEDKFKKIKI
ncbi:MAG: phosphatase PAP2 family protein [Clostridium sp.]|jgi:undecaprenyl-diphosphatase|nr:phosphatase PAP2 family protein [Clostridium sp.]